MAAQADEVDGRYLHFENDLKVTSSFLAAVFSISEISKQPPLISDVSFFFFFFFFYVNQSYLSSRYDEL